MAKLNRIRVVLAERDLNNKWLSDKLSIVCIIFLPVLATFYDAKITFFILLHKFYIKKLPILTFFYVQTDLKENGNQPAEFNVNLITAFKVDVKVS